MIGGARMSTRASDHLQLADWRRRVAELYAQLRADERPASVRAEAFRAARDRLFAEHPCSPLPESERPGFGGLAYFPHEPSLALRATLEPDPELHAPQVPLSADGPVLSFARIGWVSFSVAGQACRLSAFWLNDYAGGLFIPFRDATNGRETYGAGRYLWDSAKGADLGSSGDELVLDFNYAYHPSCAYDPIWACPLAPAENWLAVSIRAGERLEKVGA